VFNDLLRVSNPTSDGKKTTFYVSPLDFMGCCGIYEVEVGDREVLWTKVLILQELWNGLRPNDPKPKKSPGGKGRRRR
jgi:hypothetical protein